MYETSLKCHQHCQAQRWKPALFSRCSACKGEAGKKCTGVIRKKERSRAFTPFAALHQAQFQSPKLFGSHVGAVLHWQPCPGVVTLSWHFRPNSPVLAVLFSLFCPACPFLSSWKSCLSCSSSPVLVSSLFCPILAALSWQPCPGSPVLEDLFCLLCPAYPILAVWLWPSCSGCPFLAILLWLSFSGCPLLSVLPLLSYASIPVLAALFWQLCPGSPVMAVLFYLSCSSSPLLAVLSWLF